MDECTKFHIDKSNYEEFIMKLGLNIRGVLHCVTLQVKHLWISNMNFVDGTYKADSKKIYRR